MVTARALLTLLPALVLLAACGAPSGGDGPSPAVPGDDPVVRPRPSAFLTIRAADGEGGMGQASVFCTQGEDRATGYLEQERADEICRRVEQLTGFLTSRPPRNRVCAEVYGGPATARISGRLDMRPVDRRLARTDACEIAAWDRLDALLPDVE